MAIEEGSIKLGLVKEVDLTGQVFAVYEEDTMGIRPVLLELPQLGPCLPLFKNRDDLEEYFEMARISGYTIKQIDNGPEFMKSSIQYPILCDMKYYPNEGKSRWKLVRPPETM